MESAANQKKVLFVTPPYHCGMVEVVGRWIPLNFVYLAGAVRQAGFRAEIYDAMTKDHGYRDIEKRFIESKPQYVAVTAMTATIKDAVKTLELAKRLDPNVVTILGGVHPSFMYQEVLQKSAAVDYVVTGEGEVTLPQLLSALEAGSDPATVTGVALRQGSEIVKTPKQCLMDNLDDLPLAWDLVEWPDYKYFLIPDSRLGAISTSRGCDHSCTFCSQQKFWEKSWRARNPEKVADELEMLYHSYGVNVFLITDEYPTKDRERWEAILDAVIARALPLYFIVEVRPDDVIRDRDILWKYRKAGVVHVYIGIEATDQATLDALQKDAKVDDSKLAIDLLHEHGMVTEASFMLGFPDETVDSVRKTLKLAQYYNPDNAHFLAVTPWPYADMYEEVKQYVKETDYDQFNQIEPVIEPKQMSMLQIDVAIVDCYRKFYMGKIAEMMMMKDEFKRGYLMRGTKLIMSSAFIMRKLGMGVMGKVPAKVQEMRQRRAAA